LKPWKTQERSCLVLADYNQDVTDITFDVKTRFGYAEVREHPANTSREMPALSSAITLRDVVVGHSGTAIFEAIVRGVPVICTDPRNPCMPVCSKPGEPLYRGDREAWLHDMSYTQWSLAEIASGEAWEHLKDIQ
jgi:hypothetical protein